MPDKFELQKFAVPAVAILIAFLSYPSQWLFLWVQPGPLSRNQQWRFNVLVACIWITYFRAIVTDPGKVPDGWGTPKKHEKNEDQVRHRYCRKCEALKPPRSHHCKVCKRCIPKMDHHCPWTSNCVSHFTFPHFMRFLFYAVTTMSYLEYFLWIRVGMVWQNRKLPSYLGPSGSQFALLFVLILVNTLTLFAVFTMLARSLYDLCCNTTTIETWEIERHERLLRRSRALGGYLDGPDGIRIKLTRQEFPYDIGIWPNICQGMGTKNFLAWLWPFAATPVTDGLAFETNGFEDPGTSWPPPDPDRMPGLPRYNGEGVAFTYKTENLTPAEELLSFKQRQLEDYEKRFASNRITRRKPFPERYDPDTYQPLQNTELDNENESGEEGWQDSGGSRLRDYGVDEDVEFYDEDNVPIAELLRRRRKAQNVEQGRPID